MKVIFTPLAERQIGDLHRYITEASGFETGADRYIVRIVEYCLGLELFPERGRLRDDLLPGLRTIGFERRVTIAYLVMNDTLLIEGIYYGGQDIDGAYSD
ncbi:type II toxin-antitoxin system RelE/ParE family toxin [Asticcacaulis sp. YBE204]|uniref:type II toxin-antitoxin system RelE/ParE family toxin n=1 Tax=Asticcacaulis sp. YBE204 TaxID=1282363 RepID=UPI0003C3CE45|nr:type II toxin-antitoxin system RelE/ParE family toxin [Asticcacaulis sp. YBE204]ESQ79823.1 hypothetical protein AEYBE204_08230 [Asticcacaulis sp. YBE204]